MLKTNDYVAIVACSNCKKETDQERIEKLIFILKKYNIHIKLSNYIFTPNTTPNLAKLKADELDNFYKDSAIKIIFDISGGDYANTLLPHINFETIKNSDKFFVGYSDLTTIINAIYTKTNAPSLLYQILNIVDNPEQEQYFKNIFLTPNYNQKINFTEINFGKISGEVAGGNIRCFLKLAGTPYFPNVKNKILLLESLSGDYARIETYFAQLSQLNVFYDANAILLGQFTELDTISKQSVIEIAKKYVKNKALYHTDEIGHSKNSKAIWIGKNLI